MKVNTKVVSMLKKGNENAFNKIYKEYYKLVFLVVYSIVKDTMESDDLSQEIFIKMYEKVKYLNNESKFESWFMMIVRNHALDYLRKKKKREDLNNEAIDNLLDNDDCQNNFMDIECLDDLEKEIFKLHFINNYTLKDISEKLGYSIDTIKKKYSKALNKIRKIRGN